MKAQITQDANNGNVTLAHDETQYGRTGRVERIFMCPVNGGYVREFRNSDHSWYQVCDKLSSTGSTLMCSSRDKLLDLIRGEYRAMRIADKKLEHDYA